MAVYRLAHHTHHFPNPNRADANGLLAVGGDLHPNRLLNAYRMGIFPWFEHDETLFWFSPDPRAVLYPAKLKIHKSMRSIFNQQKFHYTFDECFEAVMYSCATNERGQEEGSWISDTFIDGYTALHHAGYAHSVEVWSQEGVLVGGLYGVSIGKIFFGESMFTRIPNASKAGFITLVRVLQQAGFEVIDCQQETQHLLSLGAEPIPRTLFLELLKNNKTHPDNPGKWNLGANGTLEILPLFS